MLNLQLISFSEAYSSLHLHIRNVSLSLSHIIQWEKKQLINGNGKGKFEYMVKVLFNFNFEMIMLLSFPVFFFCFHPLTFH